MRPTPRPAVRAARTAGLLLVTALLLPLGAQAAHASAPPAPVTDLAAALGPAGLVLTWTASGSGTPVVRDVTAVAGSYGPTDGRAVPATAASAYDKGFTNTTTATYAVWAAESDGTLSTQAAELVVSPLPALPTATSLDVLPTAVLAGTTVRVVGHVTRNGLPFPGARVQLRSRVGGTSTVTTLQTLTAGSDGTVRGSYVPVRTRTYQLVLPGDAYSAASASTTRVVGLQPRVTAAFSSSTVPWKKSSTFRGTVAPNLAGRYVVVQRYDSGAWHNTTWRPLSSTSAWSWTVAPAVGRYTYRVLVPATNGYRGAVSPTRVLTVVPRTLYQGLSGPDVLAVEKRLAAQHYLVGPVDGYFDARLRHAVQAFQKVERLSRTGKWSATERARVLAPRGFALRYHDDRLTAEVDITRQVLVLARSGTVLKIVDISSGSEQYYYQDGVRYVAHTPRGVFRVYRKIDGIRISALGALYRPSYFYKGWAVHGSSSVPTYPASHGCVRVTNYAADWLFPRLVIGTRVAVYDS